MPRLFENLPKGTLLVRSGYAVDPRRIELLLEACKATVLAVITKSPCCCVGRTRTADIEDMNLMF